jgi:hypothetical protein
MEKFIWICIQSRPLEKNPRNLNPINQRSSIGIIPKKLNNPKNYEISLKQTSPTL